MANLKSAINWFEIPVADIERAKKFYEAVLGSEISLMNYGESRMGFLPHDQGAAGAGLATGGAIVQGPGYTPSDKGTLVYLNGGDDLSPALARVGPAGGEVLAEKFSIGDAGFIAYFRDPEGNKVALHSLK